MGIGKTTIGLGSTQTVTDFGITSIVDLILGNAGTTQHLRGSNAQIEVVRVDTDGNSMDNLVIAAPDSGTDGVVTTSDPDNYTARIDWEWKDTSGDAYTVQTGKVYKAAPASGQDVFSASSFTLESGQTSHAKTAEQVGRFQWSLTFQHQQSPSTQPSALIAEIEAGLKAFADPVVDSSTSTHITNGRLYAFFDTNASGTPSRLASPIHDGTSGWTISTTLTRDRVNHPHQFTIGLAADGPGSGTAVTGVYIGVGSITDNPRKLIFGRRENLTITSYSANYTFEFQDA